MTDAFRHVFVDTVPDEPAPGVVYVSLEYSTAVHLCACGWGLEVVTPLSPTDWQIAYDGETLSLIGGDEAVSGAGSIGNWSFPCGSHYLIRRGRVQWRRPWLPAAVAAGRAADRLAKQEQHDPMPTSDGRRNSPAGRLRHRGSVFDGRPGSDAAGDRAGPSAAPPTPAPTTAARQPGWHSSAS